jgi:hypothetical protein
METFLQLDGVTRLKHLHKTTNGVYDSLNVINLMSGDIWFEMTALPMREKIDGRCR